MSRRITSTPSFLRVSILISGAMILLLSLPIAGKAETWPFGMAAGPIKGGQEIPIYVGAGDQDFVQSGGPYSPLALDTTHHRYLVTWDECLPTDMNIYGRLVSEDGTPYGAAFLIMSSAHGPSPVYDPNNDRFLVVWASAGGIYGRLLSDDGSFWSEGFVIYPASAPVQAVFDPAGDRYLVIWSINPSRPGWNPYNLLARFVSADGQELSDVFQLTSFSGDDYGVWRFGLSYDSNHHHYLIVYGDAGDGHNYGLILDSDGDVSHGPFQVSPTGVETIAFDPRHNHFLVVYQGRKGQLVSTDGTLSGSEFEIRETSGWVTSSVYDPAYDRFWVVGWDNDHLFGQLLYPDGRRYGTATALVASLYHSPVLPYITGDSGESGFLMVWADKPYAETGPDILGQILSVQFNSYLPILLRGQ